MEQVVIVLKTRQGSVADEDVAAVPDGLRKNNLSAQWLCRHADEAGASDTSVPPSDLEGVAKLPGRVGIPHSTLRFAEGKMPSAAGETRDAYPTRDKSVR